MPYKDPEKAKAAGRRASLAHYYRKKALKPVGVCSTCPRPVDEVGFKKCSTCRKRMRAFKKAFRLLPKTTGLCSRADCNREARPNRRLCAHCASLYSKKQRTFSFKTARKNWRDGVRTEVIAAYGGVCKCCGLSNPRLLTIDHVDGYKGGPRSGFGLYLWLRKQVFPSGFRLLCMTCNTTLARHGYCPHSNLKQCIRLGRPAVVGEVKVSALRTLKREYSQKLKMECLNAYGGPVCVGCGEAHHECLSIDHKENDGADHRRKDRRARNIYVWLRTNGYPPGFQVLCMNCNSEKAFHHLAVNIVPSRSTLSMEHAHA